MLIKFAIMHSSSSMSRSLSHLIRFLNITFRGRMYGLSINSGDCNSLGLLAIAMAIFFNKFLNVRCRNFSMARYTPLWMNISMCFSIADSKFQISPSMQAWTSSLYSVKLFSYKNFWVGNLPTYISAGMRNLNIFCEFFSFLALQLSEYAILRLILAAWCSLLYRWYLPLK